MRCSRRTRRRDQGPALLLALFMLAAPFSPAPANVMPAVWLLPAALEGPSEVSPLSQAEPLPCDPRAAWRDQHDYVSCVAREALARVAAGSLTVAQGQALIRRAAANPATPLDRGDSGGRPLLTRRRP